MKTFKEYINEELNESFMDKVDAILFKLSKIMDGDNRTKKELLSQIHGLSDKTLIAWNKGNTGRLGDYTKLFQQAGIEKEMKRRGL